MGMVDYNKDFESSGLKDSFKKRKRMDKIMLN
jgi:hypothetical protein